MSGIQRATIGATIAAAVGFGVFVARQNSELREQIQTLQQQEMSSTVQLKELKHEQDVLKHRLASVKNNMSAGLWLTFSLVS